MMQAKSERSERGDRGDRGNRHSDKPKSDTSEVEA